MSISRILLAALLVCGWSCSHSPLPSQSTRPELQQSTQIKIFAFGGVGYAGTLSEGEIAFRGIVTDANALQRFHEMLAHGTPEAQMYALVGIRKLSPKAFETVAAPYVKNNSPVTTMSGCSQVSLPMSEVLAEIQKGAYDAYLNSPRAKR